MCIQMENSNLKIQTTNLTLTKLLINTKKELLRIYIKQMSTKITKSLHQLCHTNQSHSSSHSQITQSEHLSQRVVIQNLSLVQEKEVLVETGLVVS